MWNKIKLILKSVREYKKFALITPLFMIGEVLMECLLPFVMSMFIDTIEKISELPSGTHFMIANIEYYNENFHLIMNVSLLGIILTLLVLAFTSLAFGILGGKFAAKASTGLAANLRNDLYEKLESFSFSNIDKFSTSSLVTRMTTDIQTVQQSFQMCIRIVVRAPLMLVFSAVLAFITGGQLAWIFIALLPILAFLFGLIIKSAMGVFSRVFKRYDALNNSIQENVSGMRVVKSFVRESYEKEKFNNASSAITNEFIHGEKIVAFNGPIMNTAIHLSNILIMGIGALVISHNATSNGDVISWNGLSIGQLSSLLTYGVQILMSLMMVSMIMVMLVLSLEGIRRIGEVLEEESSIKNIDNPVFEIKDGSIDFDNVDFKYKSSAEKNTLDNINIHIKSGQFVGILGSTGSGKTSVINLISRLYDVSSGEVKVGGINVKNYDIKTLRDNVAVVLQKNVLFSGTIEENLRWGDLNASNEELVKACKIAHADEFVQSFPDKYQTKIEQGGTNVSGGQKQRLCIARAILKKPKILILDDSTSAVDTKTDRLIRTALKEDLPDMTKVIIAQRISSIEDADQIIILDDGKINAIGTHEELLKSNKIYQEVYYTQNKVGGDK